MLLKCLLIGTGGFFGAVCRYLAGGWVHHFVRASFFPYGTLAVNILGCFLIGFFGGIGENRNFFRPETRLLVFVGFLGGFTTFSTFGYEVFQLCRDGQLLAAGINVLTHVLLGLLAVWVGYSVSRLI